MTISVRPCLLTRDRPSQLMLKCESCEHTYIQLELLNKRFREKKLLPSKHTSTFLKTVNKVLNYFKYRY